MQKNNISLGITLAFMCLALLGLMPVISNSRPPEMNAIGFALFLSLWQLLFSLPLIAWEWRSNNRGIFAVDLSANTKQRTLVIILVTGFIFGISTYLYVLSVEKAGTVSAAIAMQAYPLFAILWETLFLKKHKTKTELFFTFLLLTALYYLATAGTWSVSGITLWFLAALSVPFLWSVAHVIIKEVMGKTPITPAQITFFRVLVSSLALFIIALMINGPGDILSAAMDIEYQKFAMIMGFVYYLELIFWFYAVKHIDVSVASSITTPWPVVTMALATIFLHEEIEQYQVLTMIFVALSVYGLLYAGKLKRAAIAE